MRNAAETSTKDGYNSFHHTLSPPSRYSPNFFRVVGPCSLQLLIAHLLRVVGPCLLTVYLPSERLHQVQGAILPRGRSSHTAPFLRRGGRPTPRLVFKETLPKGRAGSTLPATNSTDIHLPSHRFNTKQHKQIAIQLRSVWGSSNNVYRNTSWHASYTADIRYLDHSTPRPDIITT